MSNLQYIELIRNIFIMECLNIDGILYKQIDTTMNTQEILYICTVWLQIVHQKQLVVFFHHLCNDLQDNNNSIQSEVYTAIL